MKMANNGSKQLCQNPDYISKKELKTFLDGLDQKALSDEKTLPDDKKEDPEFYEGIWLTTRAICINFEITEDQVH
jgi:hypothetical protein